MQRKEGRGGFVLKIDHPGQGQPIRLFLQFIWPPSEVHVDERFDDACDAVLNGGLEGKWQRVIAEVRLRAQCDLQAGGSIPFLSRELGTFSKVTENTLGKPISFLTASLHVAPASQPNDPIEAPARELTVEVLREDAKSLYLELVSRWTQVPIMTVPIELDRIRPITAKPSEYIEDARTALRNWIDGVAKDGSKL
jgi:hypothetical protein